MGFYVFIYHHFQPCYHWQFQVYSCIMVFMRKWFPFHLAFFKCNTRLISKIAIIWMLVAGQPRSFIFRDYGFLCCVPLLVCNQKVRTKCPHHNSLALTVRFFFFSLGGLDRISLLFSIFIVCFN